MAQNGVTFWRTIGEFKAERPPEERKLIDPILAYGGAIGLLHGPRGAGKTQIALSLALAVGRGEPWLGLYPTKESRVAFIQLDMPRQTMWERINALNGSCRGNEFSIITWDRAFDIASGKNVNILELATKAAPELIFVESLRKSHHLDENDSNTPSFVYKLWQERFNGASVVFSHHDRKVPLDSEPKRRRDEGFRGSSAWSDDADLGIHVVPENQEADLAQLHVRIEFSKVRSCAMQPPISVRFHETSLLPYLVEPSPETALRVEMLKRTLVRPEAVAFLLELGVKERTAWRIAERLLIPKAP